VLRTLRQDPADGNFHLVNGVFVESELPLTPSQPWKRGISSAEHDPYYKYKVPEQQTGVRRCIWSIQSRQRMPRRAPGQVSMGNRVRRRPPSQQQAVEISSRQSGCTLDTPEQRSRSAPGEGRSAPPAPTAARTYGGKQEVAAIS